MQTPFRHPSNIQPPTQSSRNLVISNDMYALDGLYIIVLAILIIFGLCGACSFVYGSIIGCFVIGSVQKKESIHI